jgi:hypothetical protein
MIFVLTLLVLALLAVFTLFAFITFKAEQVYMRRRLFQDILWERRNRIPLLLELARKYEVETAPEWEEVRHFRARLQDGTLAFQEIGHTEKKLAHSIKVLLEGLERNKEWTHDVDALSLKGELLEVENKIQIGVNDYNFTLAEWNRYTDSLFLRPLRFLFEVSDFKPLIV